MAKPASRADLFDVEGDDKSSSNYSAKDIVIRNSDIQGVRVGIEAPVAGFGPT